MITTECREVNEVDNLRIHVEHVTNRLKKFCVVNSSFPLTMLTLANDMLCSCAAICDIKPPLHFGKDLKSNSNLNSWLERN